MKHWKKLLVVAAAVVMAMALAVPAFAQTVGNSAANTGSITINNAANGETYSVVKIFGATITDDATASTDASGIAYTGDIPDDLTTYFEKDSTGNILRKSTATDDAALLAAVQAYAKTQDATASAVSDGSVLVFQGLDYGYYAVISTQGATVTIDSLRPNATVNDKNTKDLTATKTVDDQDVSVGQTVEYTAVFDTANYRGEKQVKSYTISDTLPDFLTNVRITSLKVIETPAAEATGNPGDPDYVPAVTEVSTNLSGSYTAFTDKKIVIPWVDDNNKSLYKNGSQIELKYTATVTASADVDGTAGNVNKVTITPNEDKDGQTPFNEHKESEQKIFTYAAALQKVDNDKKPLAGAEFTIAGLQATGSNGVYTVTKYDPEADPALTPTTLTTDADGQLVILGIASDETLVATETKAPDGYNKLTTEVNLVPTKTGEVITVKEARDIYYDEDGHVISDETTTDTVVEDKATYSGDLLKTAIVVVNNKGTELPSTGGMGTTILYIIGAIFVIGAGVYLITRRRAAKESNVNMTEEK